MKWFNYFFWILFLTCTWRVFAETTNDHQGHSSRPTAGSDNNLTVSKPTLNELRVYLALIEDRKLQLEKANEALLKNADYAYWKTGAFVAKAALDGYASGKLVSGFKGLTLPAVLEGGSVRANPGLSWSREAVQKWIAEGGLKKLRTVGFDVGMVGLSSAANSVLAEDNHWTYHIPIFGTAFVAYTWSKKLMNTPELIEQNGLEIQKLTREKFKVENYIKELQR